MNPICNFCNNTDDVCCHEAIRTDNKAQAHIIDAQDEHHHDEADAHVFMLNGLLVAKDVPMPKAGVEARLEEDQKLKTFTTALRNGKQTLSRSVEIDLRVKGETNIDKYTTQGHSRETFHAAIFRMRNKGLLIVRQGDVYKLVG